MNPLGITSDVARWQTGHGTWNLLHLWLGLGMPCTNEMLNALRAEGYYYGQQAVLRRRGASTAKLRPPQRSHSRMATEIRRFAALRAREVGLRPVMRPVSIYAVLWTSSGKQDPDAWYLPTKHATDGLVDAKVFLSDRFDLANSAGTVAKVYEPARTSGWPFVPVVQATPGLALYLVEHDTL